MSPAISVVMSTYNACDALPATLDSIFAQRGCEFEVVVVDDGSSDASAELLAAWAAREPRLRVLSQRNQGLTRALQRACAEARGEFIARQDVGDLSLPGRLAAQRELLDSDERLAFVGCRYELVGPQGEPLVAALPALDASGGGGVVSGGRKLPLPHHGSVMFRKSVYLAAGGYRAQFYFAQDVDLWLRMIEHGELAYVREVLYRVKFELGSITARNRSAQQALRTLAMEAAAARARGRGEAAQLEAASRIRPSRGRASAAWRTRGAAEYFVGSCLLARGDPRAARGYLLRAVRNNPLHVKAWLRLASMQLLAGRAK